MKQWEVVLTYLAISLGAIYAARSGQARGGFKQIWNDVDQAKDPASFAFMYWMFMFIGVVSFLAALNGALRLLGPNSN